MVQPRRALLRLLFEQIVEGRQLLSRTQRILNLDTIRVVGLGERIALCLLWNNLFYWLCKHLVITLLNHLQSVEAVAEGVFTLILAASNVLTLLLLSFGVLWSQRLVSIAKLRASYPIINW